MLKLIKSGKLHSHLKGINTNANHCQKPFFGPFSDGWT